MSTLEQQMLGAARDGHILDVERLLLAGADVHNEHNLALWLAATRGHHDIVALLLKSGADVHARNDFALRWATEKGHLNVVELLLNSGADMTAFVLSDVKEEWCTVLLKKHASTAYRGIEAVFMIDENSRMDVLSHLHPDINPKQIREELAMFEALGLDAAQSGAIWKDRHDLSKQPEMDVSP